MVFLYATKTPNFYKCYIYKQIFYKNATKVDFFTEILYTFIENKC